MPSFIAGNFWLFISLMLFLLKDYHPSRVDHLTFWGIGNPIHPTLYYAITIGLAIFGALLVFNDRSKQKISL